MTALPMADTAPVILRVVELADVGRTAHIHAASLPGGFFVALGQRFLRCYHRTFLTSPAGGAILAESEGVTVGFIVGTIDEATHYRHVVRRDRWSLGARGLLALITKPRLALRFVRTRALRYGRGLVRLSRRPAELPSEVTPLLTCGVLSHMAVEPSSRGAGIGATLLSAFEETACALGARTVRLSTATDNTAAQSFYERAGWQRSDVRSDVDGHSWVHYSRSLR